MIFNAYKQLLFILDDKESKKLNVILFFNFFLFILESLSLVSIPIFLLLITKSDLFYEKLRLIFNGNYIFNYIFFIKLELLAIIFLSFILIFFLIKNLFLIFISFYQGNYLKNLKIRLAEKLFKFYINSSYLYHVKNNPSKISRNIHDEINGVETFLIHFTTIVRELQTVFIIFILLAINNLILTIGIFVFFASISFTYIKILKPFLKKKVEQNQDLRKNIIQIIYETFGSIKDIKILSKEKETTNFFKNNIHKYEDNYFYFSFLERIPRFILEFLSITVITVVFLFLFRIEKSFYNYFPTMVLLVVGIIRFIPAFNAITLGSYYLKIFSPSIESISKELLEMENNDEKNKIEILSKNNNYPNFADNNSFLIINNICFSYLDNKIASIQNLSLNINEGNVVGITGPTGSGKSTLFHLMLGLLIPNSGNIFYKKKSIYNDLSSWRREIAYVSQNIYLLDSTIKRNIAFNFLNEKIDDKKLDKAIKIAELEETILSLPYGLESKVGSDGLRLSGGEKQRVAIARAIYMDPNIIFMDESTSALDTNTESKIMKNLKEYFNKKTIVLIAHRKTTIDKCDKVWSLKDGQLFNI
jgi:ABC-type bacteriocin/lantibiotic exporter with double-glycine peptidase domain